MRVSTIFLLASAVSLTPRVMIQQGCGPDFDGDGYPSSQDCDEDDISVHNDAPELCDEKDNDCNGAVDDSCLGTSLKAVPDRLVGSQIAGYAGSNVRGLGDFNGDGFGDLVVGAPDEAAGGNVYIVPGPVTGTQDLAESASLIIHSTEPYDYLGMWMEVADLNADGLDDVILTHNVANSEKATAIFYAPFDTGEVSVMDADVVLTADASVRSELAPECFRDVTGDGIVDLFYWLSDPNTSDYTGYLFAGPMTGTIDPAHALAIFHHEEEVYDSLYAFCGGDVNGDGANDLAISNLDVNWYAGETYLFHGPFSGDYKPSGADAVVHGDSGLQVDMVQFDDDLNGDGMADLLFPSNGANGSTGAVFAVFGPYTGDMQSADAEMVYLGEESADEAGRSTWLTDFNGDGQKDLLVGAPYSNKAGWGMGMVYVVDAPQAGTHALADEPVFYFGEVEFALAGAILGPVGDVNGDGFEDFAAGEPNLPEASAAGMVYLVYGPVLP